MAAVSISRLAECGLGGAMTRFVSLRLSREDMDGAAGILTIGGLATSALLLVALAVLLPLAIWLLPVFIGQGAAAYTPLLVLAVPCIFLLANSTVLQSGLEGALRSDSRMLATTAANVSYVAGTVLLVPQFGLIGFALAQVLQSMVLCAALLIFVKRLIPPYPRFRSVEIRPILREIVPYGAQFQLITLMLLLFDPTTKIILARFGGLDATGYFEMANKLVLQIRALLVAANQAIVPVVSRLGDSVDRAAKIYRLNYEIIASLSVPIFSVIACAAGLASLLWIGRVQPAFVHFVIIISFGYLINTLSAPAYFQNLGSGQLFWNTLGHVIIAIGNLGFGVLGGILFGAEGVVAGAMAALIAGSVVILVAFHRPLNLDLGSLMPDFWQICAGIAGFGVALMLTRTGSDSGSAVKIGEWAIVGIVIAASTVAFALSPTIRSLKILLGRGMPSVNRF
ncbi:MAG: oligosaccharide flippase family protein [Terrimicrobiaceae bacterium]|nr:oligosaccharide flippase family protein [Terrimicrobiaceae bacterium]